MLNIPIYTDNNYEVIKFFSDSAFQMPNAFMSKYEFIDCIVGCPKYLRNFSSKIDWDRMCGIALCTGTILNEDYSSMILKVFVCYSGNDNYVRVGVIEGDEVSKFCAIKYKNSKRWRKNYYE